MTRTLQHDVPLFTPTPPFDLQNNPVRGKGEERDWETKSQRQEDLPGTAKQPSLLAPLPILPFLPQPAFQ